MCCFAWSNINAELPKGSIFRLAFFDSYQRLNYKSSVKAKTICRCYLLISCDMWSKQHCHTTLRWSSRVFQWKVPLVLFFLNELNLVEKANRSIKFPFFERYCSTWSHTTKGFTIVIGWIIAIQSNIKITTSKACETIGLPCILNIQLSRSSLITIEKSFARPGRDGVMFDKAFNKFRRQKLESH